MSRYVVMGIDPSSAKIAAVVTKDGGKSPRVWTKVLPESPYEVRADWAERHVNKFVSDYISAGFEVYFFIEEPVVGAGARATIAQATIRGGILIGARRGGATEIHHVNNSRWKKKIVGKGNATKPQIKEHMHKTWPVIYDLADGDQDVLDAAGINAYGEGVLMLQKRIEKNKENEDG